MTDEIETANAEADQITVNNNNLSVEDFANRRLGQLQSRTGKSEEEEAEDEGEQGTDKETQEDADKSVESEESTEDTKESENVLSQLDLDDMSEEDLRELADKLGSRAVARFGELTAKRKAAEARLAVLEAKLKEEPSLLQTKKVENNPYSNLDSVEKLQAKAEEVDQVIEWAEDLLFESDGYSAEDVVTEIEGREWTKKDVRQALLKARKAHKTLLPDQLKKVQAQLDGENLNGSFNERAKKELDWLDGEDNDLRKQYEATVNDERFKQLKKIAKRESPEVAAQLDYWFAHATNSIYGRKPIADRKSSPVLNPPKSAGPSSSKPENNEGRTAKALKELESRFKQTGSANDFANLRKLKMASRS